MVGNPAARMAGLTKVLSGEVMAVTDLSGTVGCSQLFGFLGPDSSGKSTTPRMMLGPVHPTSGSAYTFGSTTSKVYVRSGDVSGSYLVSRTGAPWPSPELRLPGAGGVALPGRPAHAPTRRGAGARGAVVRREGFGLQGHRSESDQARGCSPARMTVTSRWTAASDGRLLAAARAWRQ